MKIKLTIIFTCLLSINSNFVQAEDNSDEFKLGAFSGAMKFCEDKYDSNRRFKWARLRAADEYQSMSSSGKVSYGLGRERVIRNGTYYGKKLTKGQCDKLLNLSEWKRFLSND